MGVIYSVLFSVVYNTHSHTKRRNIRLIEVYRGPRTRSEREEIVVVRKEIPRLVPGGRAVSASTLEM